MIDDATYTTLRGALLPDVTYALSLQRWCKAADRYWKTIQALEEEQEAVAGRNSQKLGYSVFRMYIYLRH